MPGHACHLVGSFPTTTATDAFIKCLSSLPHLHALPDGEPSWRWNFTIGLVGKLAAAHPSLGPIWREYDATYAPKPVAPMPDSQIQPLLAAIATTHWELGYDTDAIASYREFVSLRERGIVPAQGDLRFQVCLPGVSSIAIFAKPAFAVALEEALFATLLRETKAIVAGIPAGDLALQSDIASDFIRCEAQRYPEVLEMGSDGERERGVLLREDFWPIEGMDAMERYATQHAGVLGMAGDGVSVGVHVCMGNINNLPVLAAKNMDVMVDLVNAIAAKAGRPLQWAHFGALPEWTDGKFYEPLKRLGDKEMKIFVGIVYPDDAEGARKRLQAAIEVIPSVGIAPPCGLARTSEEGVESVFGLMRELSAST